MRDSRHDGQVVLIRPRSRTRYVPSDSGPGPSECPRLENRTYALEWAVRCDGSFLVGSLRHCAGPVRWFGIAEEDRARSISVSDAVLDGESLRPSHEEICYVPLPIRSS
jgi:hypothetical protein